MYRITLENGRQSYPELCHLYFQHYAEMCERLAEQGIVMAPYKPRLDQYFAANDAGFLLHFVARTADGEGVGYFNVYLTSDMHNGELIAREDALFVRKDHRKGLGKKLVQAALSDLQDRSVKRFNVTAATDPRAALLWQRMGFKPTAQAMTYVF